MMKPSKEQIAHDLAIRCLPYAIEELPDDMISDYLLKDPDSGKFQPDIMIFPIYKRLYKEFLREAELDNPD